MVLATFPPSPVPVSQLTLVSGVFKDVLHVIKHFCKVQHVSFQHFFIHHFYAFDYYNISTLCNILYSYSFCYDDCAMNYFSISPRQ